MIFKQFQLEQNPFLEDTDLPCLIMDRRMKEGLTRIMAFLERGPVALVLGRTGTGKSTLIRLFLEQIEKNRNYEPHYLHLAAMQSTNLLRSLVTSLGEKPKLGKDRLFKQIFDKARNQRGIILFLIDEAHHLASDALTDLRLLTSGINEKNPIRVILAGQPMLRDNLKRESLRDLRERVSMYYHIPQLDELETFEYIKTRLERLGRKKALFTEGCLKRIHHHSGGVPRVINNLATSCIIKAAMMKQNMVDEDIFLAIKEEALL
jgi:general secretion pathway protein A